MTVLSPIWLLGLIPWLALAIWMLAGRRERAAVPFLPLWRGPRSLPRPRRALHRPPLPVIALLLASLLAVVAAAEPILTLLPDRQGPGITIIVDRGLTMTARGKSQPRYAEAVQAARAPLLHRFGTGPTDVVLLPEDTAVESDRLAWFTVADRQPPTITDTQAMLEGVVRRTLAQTDGPVLLISDQAVQAGDPRFVQIAPAEKPANVGIVAAAIAASPHAQLMVGLLNDSDQRDASIMVTAGDQTISRQVVLPPRRQTRNYFIDLPDAAPTVRVAIEFNDAQPADNTAELIRQSTWPRIEVRGSLPVEVTRMIQAYRKQRPPGGQSTTLVVTGENLDPVVPGVIVPQPPADGSSGAVQVVTHPINSNVPWPQHLVDAAVAPLPRGGWSQILTVGDRPAIAIREAPARQVWVGLSSDSFARDSGFVILWTNILDWVGRGTDQYKANFVGAVPFPDPPALDWQARLATIPARFRAGYPLLAPLLILSLLLVLLAASRWESLQKLRGPLA